MNPKSKFDSLNKNIRDFLKLHARKSHILYLLIVFIFVVLGFLWLDEWTTHLLSNELSERYYQPLRKLTDIGESTHYFIISLACFFYATSVLTFRKSISAEAKRSYLRLQRWGGLFFSSLLLGGLLAHLIKFLVGRQRPHLTAGYEAFIFSPLNINWHFQSFPSGHSQTLFTAAVAFSILLPKRRLLLFVIAALLASTRIWLHQHFFSDVVLGSYIGYAVTHFLYSRFFICSSSSVS